MQADEVCYQTMAEVATRLRTRQLSPVQLTDVILERIAKYDATLRSYLCLGADEARADARTAEAEIAAGNYRGPLHGIPIAIKDLFATKAMRTSCASKVGADWIPDFDATVVRRLRAAGAVVIGKLNMTEFALSGYHRSLPIPRNPWNPERDASGSSSGSGVAVAAGLCFAATGTDTGGSIRGPSAWNGVVGLKPTYGRVSRHGVFPLAMSLDHIGPMTRSVIDAALMYEAMAGYDPQDPTSLSSAVEGCVSSLENDIARVRVGYDHNYVRHGCVPELAAAIEGVANVLANAGATIVAVQFPKLDGVLESWFPICAAEALVAHSATFPARADEYGKTFRSFLEYGAQLGGRDYAAAHNHRIEFAGELRTLLDSIDIFLCAGSFGAALPRGAIDPEGVLNQDLAPFLRFAAPFNFSGSPTLSLPCGFSSDGMPLGAQLVGRHLDEALLLRVGRAYERATDWHRHHPSL